MGFVRVATIGDTDDCIPIRETIRCASLGLYDERSYLLRMGPKGSQFCANRRHLWPRDTMSRN